MGLSVETLLGNMMAGISWWFNFKFKFKEIPPCFYPP